MEHLGVQGRQVVRTEVLLILLPPISAPGPSPSLHRKQSATRGSTLFFSSVALLMLLPCNLNFTVLFRSYKEVVT